MLSMNKLILIFVLLLISLNMFAHPHMFIDSKITIATHSSDSLLIQTDWQFDPYFSLSLIEDFDYDKNGLFEGAEIDSLEVNAFNFVQNFNYLYDVKVNESAFTINSVSNFKAYIDEEDVHYTFEYILPKKNAKIISYDPTYYIEVCALMSKSQDLQNVSFEEKRVRVNFEMYGKLPVPQFEITVNE